MGRLDITSFQNHVYCSVSRLNLTHTHEEFVMRWTVQKFSTTTENPDMMLTLTHMNDFL